MKTSLNEYLPSHMRCGLKNSTQYLASLASCEVFLYNNFPLYLFISLIIISGVRYDLNNMLLDTTQILIGQHESFSLYNSEQKIENFSSELGHSSQRNLKASDIMILLVREISGGFTQPSH